MTFVQRFWCGLVLCGDFARRDFQRRANVPPTQVVNRRKLCLTPSRLWVFQDSHSKEG